MISKNAFENIDNYLTLIYKRCDDQTSSYEVINSFIETSSDISEIQVMDNLQTYTTNSRGIIDSFLIALSLHIIRYAVDINTWLSNNSIKVTETYAENSDRLGYTIDPDNIQS
jgi:hypothetical protein